jgi:hypothetical protein
VIYRDAEIEEGSIIRTFDEMIDPIELQWHRDSEDRTIISLNETNWLIQLEDRLPQSLNAPVFIKRENWHRLIKGDGELLIKIIKGLDAFYSSGSRPGIAAH